MDYRKLNSQTVNDSYPLPNIADILDQLGNSKYFSTFDLASGYHQVLLKPEDRWKTAFATPGGLWQFVRMPMGLASAPATFQRMMEILLMGLQYVEMLVYLDDIIVYAKSLQDNERKMELLFQRLVSANLKLQPEKVQFLRKEVAFLGHVISENGVTPDPEKIKAVVNYPTPTNVKSVRQTLGFFVYYRRFIPQYAVKAKPLNDLLKKDHPFVWGEKEEQSFQTLKDCLIKHPILIYPDFEKIFTLTTDASDFAIGAVLSQEKDGFDHPIAYLSRTLNSAERNYSTTEKECLAALCAMRHFRPYLISKKFILQSNHKPMPVN